MGTQSSLGDSSGVLSMLVLAKLFLPTRTMCPQQMRAAHKAGMPQMPSYMSKQPGSSSFLDAVLLQANKLGSPDHVPGAPRMPTGQPVPSGGGDAQVAARLPGGGRPVQTAGNGQKHTIHPFKQKIEDGYRSEVKKTVCHRSDLDSQHRGRGRSGAGGTRAEHRCFEDGGKHKQQSKCILQLCHSSSFGCRRSRTFDNRSRQAILWKKKEAIATDRAPT